MSKTITFRVDAQTTRILKALARRTNGSKSAAIREALQCHWKNIGQEEAPTAWEVYSKLKIPPARGPKRDRARNISKLLKEKLLAKRRAGTL